MHIKILSMHRVINYGSFMQAYALRKVLESMGHQVTFCDFRPGLPRHLGEKVKPIRMRDRFARLPYILSTPSKYVEERRFRRELRECYQEHTWRELGISESLNEDYHGEVMIIGSDEVFNYTQNHVFGYVPCLFGHGIAADSIIAYAASAGYATSNDVEADGMQQEISSGLAKFSALGVRDQNTFDLVTRYAKNKPCLVIDPTLLYDFTTEIPSAPIAPGYVLIYAYNSRLDAPDDVANILDFARSKRLRVVSVGFYHQWCEENYVVTPFELLAVFQQATYVVTDTFHGTIFSIKSRKQFVSLLRGENRWGGNANKLGFLLQQLNLQGRINRDLSQLSPHLDLPIDYAQVELLLTVLRKESMCFLVEALHTAASKQEPPQSNLKMTGNHL